MQVEAFQDIRIAPQVRLSITTLNAVTLPSDVRDRAMDDIYRQHKRIAAPIER